MTTTELSPDPQSAVQTGGSKTKVECDPPPTVILKRANPFPLSIPRRRRIRFVDENSTESLSPSIVDTSASKEACPNAEVKTQYDAKVANNAGSKSLPKEVLPATPKSAIRNPSNIHNPILKKKTPVSAGKPGFDSLPHTQLNNDPFTVFDTSPVHALSGTQINSPRAPFHDTAPPTSTSRVNAQITTFNTSNTFPSHTTTETVLTIPPSNDARSYNGSPHPSLSLATKVPSLQPYQANELHALLRTPTKVIYDPLIPALIQPIAAITPNTVAQLTANISIFDNDPFVGAPRNPDAVFRSQIFRFIYTQAVQLATLLPESPPPLVFSTTFEETPMHQFYSTFLFEFVERFAQHLRLESKFPMKPTSCPYTNTTILKEDAETFNNETTAHINSILASFNTNFMKRQLGSLLNLHIALAPRAKYPRIAAKALHAATEVARHPPPPSWRSGQPLHVDFRKRLAMIRAGVRRLIEEREQMTWILQRQWEGEFETGMESWNEWYIAHLREEWLRLSGRL